MLKRKQLCGRLTDGFRRFSAALLTVCAAAAGCTVLPAGAAPALPFQLNPPAVVSVQPAPSDDAPSACTVSYTKDSALTEYMRHDTDERLAIRQQYGYSELWIKGQVDWSIDSPNDWHYNQYWDTDGYDAEWNQHLGEWAYSNFAVTSAKIDTDQIFRSFGDPSDAKDPVWNGSGTAPGWKDVLKAGQYELYTAPDGKQGAKIDFTKHQVYVRMRWLVTVDRDDWDHEQYLCSAWSQTAYAGTAGAPETAVSVTVKQSDDAGEGTGTTETMPQLPKIGHLAAPAVTDLHMTGDFNSDGRAIAEFTLNVPEDVSDDAERVKAAGGKLILAAAADTDGAEASTLITLEEIPLTVGERRVTFAMPDCTQCALVWYYCTEVVNPNTGEPVRTAQSDGTEQQILDVPVQTTASTETAAPAKKKSSAARAMRRMGIVILLLAGLAWFAAFFMRKYHITIRKR